MTQQHLVLCIELGPFLTAQKHTCTHERVDLQMSVSAFHYQRNLKRHLLSQLQPETRGMMDGREAWMGKNTESEGTGVRQEWTLKK